MPANINVIGEVKDMGGLKESIAEFRKHHDEVAQALLNISGIGTEKGRVVDKNEPRPEYEHQDYPRMVYHPVKGEEIALYEKHEAQLVKAGYRREPYPKPQVAVADPATEKKLLLDQNQELRGQISILTESFQQLQAQLAELTAAKK